MLDSKIDQDADQKVDLEKKLDDLARETFENATDNPFDPEKCPTLKVPTNPDSAAVEKYKHNLRQIQHAAQVTEELTELKREAERSVLEQKMKNAENHISKIMSIESSKQQVWTAEKIKARNEQVSLDSALDENRFTTLKNDVGERVGRIYEKRALKWRLIRTLRGEGWCSCVTAMSDSCQKMMRKVAKFAWLLVILGTELDLAGFCIAFPMYWGMFPDDMPEFQKVVRGFLLYGPAAYILAVKLYIDVAGSKAAQKFCNLYELLIEKEVRSLSKGDGKAAIQASTGCFSFFLSDQHAAEDARKKIEDNIRTPLLAAEELSGEIEPTLYQLKVFHFVPILRSYTVIKDMEPNDVESLFRVNGLSTFTIGFAQIVCIIMGTAGGKLQLDDTITKFGLCAQAVNIFVTALYFGTSIPSILMNISAIEAIESASQRILRSSYGKFESALAQIKEHPNDPQAHAALAKLDRMLEEEIAYFSGETTLPLDSFSYMDKLELVAALRINAAKAFLNLKV